MDWGSLVSSIFPTIGTVVGSLLGADKIEDGVIYFSHGGIKGASQTFSTAICCEDGQYLLFNQSSDQNDVVTMTFPARGQTGAETIMVKGRQSFDVTPLFADNARNDNSQFQLIACQANTLMDGKGAQQTGIKISSSGQGIQVGTTQQAIGTYLQVQVQQQQITVYPKNGVLLQSLPMVSVQGSGDTGMMVMDVDGDPQAIVIDLPQQLGKKDIVSVDVVANVQMQGKLGDFVSAQKHASLIRSVDDLTAERIKNAPRINWRNE